MATTLVGAITAGLSRDALKVAGGAVLGEFVLRGWLTPSQETLIIGALVAIVPVLLSVYSNWKKAGAQAIVAAVNAHPDIVVSNDNGKLNVTVQRPVLPPKSIAMP